MSEVREGGREEYPRPLSPRPGATAGEELPHTPTPEARGGSREEQPTPEARSRDKRSYPEPHRRRRA